MRKKLERFYSDDKDRMDKEWKTEEDKGNLNIIMENNNL